MPGRLAEIGVDRDAAVAHHRFGNRRADGAGGAGDEDDLVAQAAHGNSPGVWRARLTQISPNSPCRPLPDAKRAAPAAPFALHHGGRARPFGAQAVHLGQPLLQENRAAVGAHAALRKTCDLVRQRLGGRAASPSRHDTLAQADAKAFIRRDLAAGEDDVERPAPPDDARQPHRTAVDQRHAPAAAVDAHVGALLHHAQIAPQRQLHAARDGRPRNRRDHRLRKLQPCRPHRSARDRPTACGKIQRRHRFFLAKLGRGILEVEARAEGAARAPQHRDRLRDGRHRKPATPRSAHRRSRDPSRCAPRAGPRISVVTGPSRSTVRVICPLPVAAREHFTRAGAYCVQPTRTIMRKRRNSNLATDSMVAATSTAMTLWHRLPDVRNRLARDRRRASGGGDPHGG